MKYLVIILLLASGACMSQDYYPVIVPKDSTKLKVTKTRKTADGSTYVWMQDVDTKEKYLSLCRCPCSAIMPKKGETITIKKRKPLIHLKPSEL